MARRVMMVCADRCWDIREVRGAQTAPDFSMLQAPAQGMVRYLPGNEGVVYIGLGNQPDAFSFVASDEWGDSLIEVAVDPLLGTAGIRTYDGGGPVASGARWGILRQKSPPQTQSGTPEKDLAVGFAVIVYVDQPGLGGDRDEYEIVNGRPDPGHVFIEVIDGAAGNSTTVGFYPEARSLHRRYFPHDDGDLRGDINHPWDVKLEIAITEDQYEEIMAQIEADRQNPPPYDLNDNNCADYVLDLLDGIGIHIESEEGSWILGGGQNPGDLGQDLLELGGEAEPESGGRRRWEQLLQASGSSAGEGAISRW